MDDKNIEEKVRVSCVMDVQSFLLGKELNSLVLNRDKPYIHAFDALCFANRFASRGLPHIITTFLYFFSASPFFTVPISCIGILERSFPQVPYIFQSLSLSNFLSSTFPSRDTLPAESDIKQFSFIH